VAFSQLRRLLHRKSPLHNFKLMEVIVGFAA
jgi:hypothetical protein